MASGVTPMERLHLTGTSSASRVIHYIWQETTLELADKASGTALGVFQSQTDTAELGRMLSFRGGIALKSDDIEESLNYLREAAAIRSGSDDISRLRYDLRWLASAYKKAGARDESLICAGLGLAIHKKLYGSRSVDPGLFQDLANLAHQNETEHLENLGARRKRPAQPEYPRQLAYPQKN